MWLGCGRLDLGRMGMDGTFLYIGLQNIKSKTFNQLSVSVSCVNCDDLHVRDNRRSVHVHCK